MAEVTGDELPAGTIAVCAACGCEVFRIINNTTKQSYVNFSNLWNIIEDRVVKPTDSSYCPECGSDFLWNGVLYMEGNK